MDPFSFNLAGVSAQKSAESPGEQHKHGKQKLMGAWGRSVAGSGRTVGGDVGCQVVPMPQFSPATSVYEAMHLSTDQHKPVQ